MIYKTIKQITKHEFLNSFLSLAVSHTDDEYLEEVLFNIIKSTNDIDTIKTLLQSYSVILRNNRYIKNKKEIIDILKIKNKDINYGFIDDFLDDIATFYKS